MLLSDNQQIQQKDCERYVYQFNVHLDGEEKGWKPKYDGCEVEETANGQSYN